MLSVNQLTFKVKNKTLIDELTLNVTPGSFYALLGRKGSGKTTLLRLCSGLLEPQSGNIYINGMDVSKRENKKNILRILGYMGSQDGYFPRLQVMEYLEVYAHAQGLYGLAARERCMEVLQMGHLERRAEQLVEEQSASVRRELSFLRAIIHRPRLLLLDDPFNGMESAQKLAMEELFAILAEDEVTVLMASQSLPDAAHLCGEIGIIEKGRIISEGNLSDILRQARSEALLYLRVCEAPEAAVAILRKEALVRTISRDGNFIVMHFAGGIKDEAALLKKLIGVTTREREYDKERIRQKKEKEDGIRKSQRLLLTWLIERPELFEKIRGIITPEDFDDELYREAASMVFEEYEKTGGVNPAQILNHFIEGEEQYREVAALFHATLSESLNNEEQRRAFSETVKKIKKHSLDVKGKTADIRELQEIIRQQSELAALNITLD